MAGDPTKTCVRNDVPGTLSDATAGAKSHFRLNIYRELQVPLCVKCCYQATFKRLIMAALSVSSRKGEAPVKIDVL